MGVFDVLLRITGIDQASSVIQGVGDSLGRMAEIAGGIQIQQTLSAAAGAMANFAKEGLVEAGAYQESQMALAALLALEEKRASRITKDIVTGYETIKITEKETAALGKLQTKLKDQLTDRDLLSARIQEQMQKVWEMKNRWTDEGLATKTAQARLADMQGDLEILNASIDANSSKVGKLSSTQSQQVPIMKRIVESEMTYSEALNNTSQEAANLFEWLRDIGIERGIPAKDLAGLFRYGVGLGISSDQMRDLTENSAMFSVAMGKTPADIQRLIKAFADVQTKGKLAGEELRQFANSNIPMIAILADMYGVTTQEVVKMVQGGLVPANDVINAAIGYMGQFGEAADLIGGSLPRVSAGMSEIKRTAISEFFSGAATAISGFLGPYRELFLVGGEGKDPFAGIRAKGDEFGGWLTNFLNNEIRPFADKLAKALSGGELKADASLIPPEMQAALQNSTLGGNGAPTQLDILFQNIAGAIREVGDAAQTKALPALNNLKQQGFGDMGNILSEINKHWDGIKVGIEVTAGIIVSTAIVALLISLGGAFAGLVGPIGAVAGLMGIVAAAWTEDLGGLQTAIKGFLNTLRTDVPEIDRLMKQAGISPADTAGGFYAGPGKNVAEQLSAQMAAMRENADALQARRTQGKGSTQLIIEQMFNAYIFEPIKNWLTNLPSKLYESWKGATETLGAYFEEAGRKTSSLTGEMDGLTASSTLVATAIHDLVSDMISASKALQDARNGLTPPAPPVRPTSMNPEGGGMGGSLQYNTVHVNAQGSSDPVATEQAARRGVLSALSYLSSEASYGY